MSVWDILESNQSKCIGEVASVEGNFIEVFVYPEFFHKVKIGTILYIASEKVKPIGLVSKLIHSSRYRGFTPLKSSREEIQRAYPDIKDYHRFISTLVYTSHLDQGRVRHFRSAMPLLHDLVYIIEDSDMLDEFFKPNGDWDFSFLEYFARSITSYLELKDFLMNYSDYLKENQSESELIVSMISDVLLKVGFHEYDKVIEVLEEIFSD